jgi:hypothetical protein
MYIKDFVLYPLIDDMVVDIKNDLGMDKEEFFNIDFSFSEGGSNLMFYKVYSKYLNGKTFKDLLGQTEVVCKCRFCGAEFSYGQFTEFIPKLYKFAKNGLETNGFYCSRSCSNKHSGKMQYHREEGMKNLIGAIESGKTREGYVKWERQMKEKFGADFRKKLIKDGKWSKPFFTEEARKKIAIKKLNWTEEQKKEIFEKRMETHFLNETKLFGDNNDKSYSLISKECFERLIKRVRKEISDFEGKYADNEHIIGSRFLDFYNERYGVWIEFHGNYFHANPEIYNENDVIVLGEGVKTTAGEIWQKDEKRIDEIKKNLEIEPIIIWERDYRKDKDYCLRKVVKQIVKGINK